MKFFSFLTLMLICISTAEASLSQINVLNMDLQMTGYEYRQLTERAKLQKPLNNLSNAIYLAIKPKDILQDIVDIGERNLDWLEEINRLRPDNAKLELSSPSSAGGIPITKPNETNRKMIEQDFTSYKTQIPKAVYDVLSGNDTLPASTIINEQEFLTIARDVNYYYKTASRWLLHEPDLASFAERAYKDIRGYYFLEQEQNLNTKLEVWAMLDVSVRNKLQPWLISMCMNSKKTAENCNSEWNKSVSATGNALEFYRLITE